MNEAHDFYSETHQTWNKLAKLYEEKFMDLDLYNDGVEMFCAQISNTSPSILEIGCGPGNITKQVLNHLPDAQILGIDVAENMITRAKNNFPKAVFQTMDCREITNLGKAYDAIICGFTIPYLSKEDVKKLIADCAYLLNSEGLLYLSFVDGNYKNSTYLTTSAGDRTYFHYYHAADILEMLEENALKITGKQEINFEMGDRPKENHIVMTFKKAD